MLSSPRGDPLLAAFLRASSDDEAEAALAPLLDGGADGVLRESVRRSLAGSARSLAETDDVIGDVRVRLIRKLWALRRGAGEPIENFHAYVATTATRTAYADLRERYPARTRLRNRVRYALSHHPSTELRADAAGIWHGLTRTAVREAPVSGSTVSFIDGPVAFLSRHQLPASTPLPALLAALLDRLDVPIELDRLVDALIIALGIVELEVASSRDAGEAARDDVADPARDIASTLEERETLRRLWDEIAALPPNQRSALLLNLRDPEGGAMLHVLPATEVVSMAELAAALSVDGPALAAMWDRLPLDDLAIAEALGLSRQQVINLRKSARARLSRRTKGTR
ncbi:MAG: hypothetical protein ABI665_00690 [Vicinamibacterales bacterium]